MGLESRGRSGLAVPTLLGPGVVVSDTCWVSHECG